MAIASPDSELDICNMALNKCGVQSITATQLTADSMKEAKSCNLHYAQTRDALLRSHVWRFAKARDELTSTTAVDFEWTYAFTLPTDFLRALSVYEDNNTIRKNLPYTYEIEGSILLTEESSCSLRYIKQVTDVSFFDPLFIEVFVMQLALKIVYPIAGVGSAGRALAAEIKTELYGIRGRPGLMSRVRAIDKKEGLKIGISDRPLWNNARRTLDGRIDSKMGS